MSKMTRKEVRSLIIESIAGKESKRKSEIRQFSESRGGKKVAEAGNKIMNASRLIQEVGSNHTGKMRETLSKIAEFVEKTGKSLSEMNSLNEGSSMVEGLPTMSELKELYKLIGNLEK